MREKRFSIIHLIIIVIALIFTVGIYYENKYENKLEELNDKINSTEELINELKVEIENKDLKISNQEDEIESLQNKLDNLSSTDSNTDSEPVIFTDGPSNSGTDLTEEIVYITNKGTKYHRSGCSYLKSSNPITKKDAISQGYSPCSRCNP